MIKSPTACPPSDRLNHLVLAGMKSEGDSKEDDNLYMPPVSGLDLDFETESHSNAPEPRSYETVYVTSHKGKDSLSFLMERKV